MITHGAVLGAKSSRQRHHDLGNGYGFPARSGVSAIPLGRGAMRRREHADQI